MTFSVKLATCAFLILISSATFKFIRGDDATTNDEVYASTVDIIRMRGYLAEDHYITTPDGYIINLIRASNPLIKSYRQGALRKKDPLLCIHGITVSSRYFVSNSVNARPKNYSPANATALGAKNLATLLKDDPASNSIVFLALNFGHEVWLHNQRGTSQSLGHRDKDKQPFIADRKEDFDDDNNLTVDDTASSFVALANLNVDSTSKLQNKTTHIQVRKHISNLFKPHNLGQRKLNPKYWNFTLDQQVQYDLPMAIDYILEKTNRTKLATVGHSQGGSFPLMLLVDQPEFSRKISKNILWAPALYPTSVTEVIYAYLLGPLFEDNIGATPSPSAIPIMQGAFAKACRSELAQLTYCAQLLNVWFGYSANQLLVKPGMLSSFLDSASSLGMAQMAQAARKGKMSYFDYNDPRKNKLVYGQATAPLYNISKISEGSIAMWAGNTDVLAPLHSIVEMAKDLNGGVHLETNYINKSGIFFNHASFILHKNVSRLVIQPSLRYLES